MIFQEGGRWRSELTEDERQQDIDDIVAKLSPDELQALEHVLGELRTGETSEVADTCAELEWEEVPLPIEEWIESHHHVGDTAETLFPVLKKDIIELFTGGYHEVVLCLHPKTRIPLLDGSTPTLKDLAERWDSNEEPFWVYSYVDGELKPAQAIQPRKTGVDDYFRVSLDDGTSFTGNARHQMLLRTGEKRMIKDMSPGDSLMPFNTRLSKGESRVGYEQIQGLDGKWRFTHRIVAESLCNRSNGEDTVHHKDFDKLNNTPENLQRTVFLEHSRMHSELTRRRNLDGLASKAGKVAWKHRLPEAKVAFGKLMAERNRRQARITRKDITLEAIESCAATNLRQAAVVLGCSGARIRKILKCHGLSTKDVFGATYRRGRKNKISKDRPVGPKPKLAVADIERAIAAGSATTRACAAKLGVNKKTIYNTLKREGVQWDELCELVGNHYVVKIEKIGRGPVYCMTVPGAGNFAISTATDIQSSSIDPDRGAKGANPTRRAGVVSSNTGSIRSGGVEERTTLALHA